MGNETTKSEYGECNEEEEHTLLSAESNLNAIQQLKAICKTQPKITKKKTEKKTCSLTSLAFSHCLQPLSLRWCHHSDPMEYYYYDHYPLNAHSPFISDAYSDYGSYLYLMSLFRSKLRSDYHWKHHYFIKKRIRSEYGGERGLPSIQVRCMHLSADSE